MVEGNADSEDPEQQALVAQEGRSLMPPEASAQLGKSPEEKPSPSPKRAESQPTSAQEPTKPGSLDSLPQAEHPGSLQTASTGLQAEQPVGSPPEAGNVVDHPMDGSGTFEPARDQAEDRRPDGEAGQLEKRTSGSAVVSDVPLENAAEPSQAAVDNSSTLQQNGISEPGGGTLANGSLTKVNLTLHTRDPIPA